MKKNLIEIGATVEFKAGKDLVNMGVVAEKGVYQASLTVANDIGGHDTVKVPYKDVLGFIS